MFALKRLSKEAVPAALARAERYRFLNEPSEAESICLDVLDVDPGNQEALVTLLLALTDQFGEVAGAVGRAREAAGQLLDAYAQAYYGGIIRERRAKAQLRRGGEGAVLGIYECLVDAMEHYEQAAELRPPGNDDAILRWNACARLLMRSPHLRPVLEDRTEVDMLE
jgi:tetratricopeptide (TPR) repeat protein